MGLFNSISDVASNLGNKANDALETTKLKSRISSEKKAIELELAKIGKISYEKFKAGGEAENVEKVIFESIDKRYATISDTEKTLELYNNPKI